MPDLSGLRARSSRRKTVKIIIKITTIIIKIFGWRLSRNGEIIGPGFWIRHQGWEKVQPYPKLSTISAAAIVIQSWADVKGKSFGLTPMEAT
jgi:hypothetical protein